MVPRVWTLGILLGGCATEQPPTATTTPAVPIAETAESFRVERIALTLDLRPRLGTLAGTATLDVRGLGARSIELFLNRSFTIEEARVDGVPTTAEWTNAERELPYVPSARALEVAVPPSVARPQSIELRYRGEVREPIADVNIIQADRVELAAYAAYFPRPFELPPFAFRLHVELPDGFTVVTRGRRTEHRREDGRMVETWESTIEGNDIPLFASNDVQSKSDIVDGTPVEVYYRELSPAQAGAALRDAVDSLRFLTREFGAAEADALRIVFSPRPGWGYSRTGWLIVSEQRHLDLLAGRTAADEGVPADAGAHGNAHEISHFWWRIAEPTTQHDWLNEALAEYSAAIDSRRRGGEELHRRWAESYRSAVRRAAPSAGIVATTAADEHRYVNWYQRGALFFICTEQRVGAERLRKALRRLLELGRASPVVTDDVLGVLREAGVDDAWLDAWLRSPDLAPLDQCVDAL